MSQFLLKQGKGQKMALSTEILEPYSHTCDTEGCESTFQDGDTCIEETKVSGWVFHYCSMDCAKSNRIDFPKKIKWQTADDTCGLAGCVNVLNVGTSYFRVIGWQSLCCSKKCAEIQFNRVWGQFEPDRSELLMKKAEESDYFKQKRTKFK